MLAQCLKTKLSLNESSFSAFHDRSPRWCERSSVTIIPDRAAKYYRKVHCTGKAGLIDDLGKRMIWRECWWHRFGVVLYQAHVTQPSLHKNRKKQNNVIEDYRRRNSSRSLQKNTMNVYVSTLATNSLFQKMDDYLGRETSTQRRWHSKQYDFLVWQERAVVAQKILTDIFKSQALDGLASLSKLAIDATNEIKAEVC